MILLQVVVSGLLMGSVYALFSSGLTLIWGMMNVINFAHGDFVMLAMYAAFFAFTLLKLGPVFFIPGAAALLFVLGVVVYLGLVRHVAKGPMLAQILGTFGLALVLRYAAFWAFTANFVSLPDNLVGGTFDIYGLRIEASRLLAGVLAIVITIGMHLVLTRTALGSRLLAVAEDRNAAMLMGIRPDRMQAIAWGIGAASTGVAGALIALFFYISPTVGEFAVADRLRRGLSRRLRQRAGRVDRRPGDRRDRGAVGLPDRRGVSGRGGLCAVPGGPVGPPARPDGDELSMKQWPLVVIGFVFIAAWPLVVQDVFLPAHRRAGAAGGDLGLGVEPAGRLCRAGLGRARGVFRRRRLCLAGGLHRTRLAADRRRAGRRGGFHGDLGADRHADVPAARALFLHGDDRGGRAVPDPGGQLAAAGRGGRADGTAGAADPVRTCRSSARCPTTICSWRCWLCCWG